MWCLACCITLVSVIAVECQCCLSATTDNRIDASEPYVQLLRLELYRVSVVHQPTPPLGEIRSQVASVRHKWSHLRAVQRA